MRPFTGIGDETYQTYLKVTRVTSGLAGYRGWGLTWGIQGRRMASMKIEKAERLPATHTPLTTNRHLVRWVEKMADLCQPEAIHWIDGSEAENERLCQEPGGWGDVYAAERGALAGVFLCPVGSERCGAGGGSDVYLFACRRIMLGRRITGKTRS